MTETAFRAIIKVEIFRIGSKAKAAKKWGVSTGYLGDVLQGRRAPGPAILTPLGYVREVVASYKKVTK